MHLPILRAGQPYKSLNQLEVRHIASGEPLARVSQANRGLIARDLNRIDQHQHALAQLDVAELLRICHQAADLFRNGELPLDDDVQSADDYVHQVSATTGLPHTLARRNMDKIHLALSEMAAVLDGLSRGLDLSVLDAGQGVQQGRRLSYVALTQALGAVLPSNSPGVHALWLPALPLKVPLVLKPGSEEPWTPLRIARAFIAAGCPPQALSYYPTNHAGAAEILLRCNRSLLFGGGPTVAPWQDDPGVQIHGPGRSKIVFGADKIAQWEDYLDLMVDSIAANGGRSCINASGIWVPAHGREIAQALAQRLAQITPRPLDDPQAQIAAFTRPTMARQLSDMIDAQFQTPGAADATAILRQTDRVAERDGCTFLHPTLIHATSANHPLANTEFLFPFAGVVECPQEELLQNIGPSLVVTAITENEELIDNLLSSPNVERLNLGPISTNKIDWDQPHEGNLFDFLYRQRALQIAAA